MSRLRAPARLRPAVAAAGPPPARRYGRRRPAPAGAAAGLVMALALAVAGCGDPADEPEPTGPAGGAPAEWVGQVLDARQGADAPVVLAADGDQVVVVSTSEEGDIAGFASDGGGRFEAGEPLASGLRFLALGGAVRLGDAWVAVGSGGMFPDRDDLAFAVHAFRSGDGRTWQPVEATGLDGPAEVNDMAATADGVVAVGTLRDPVNPADGGFRPVVWHSRDGEGWTAVRLLPGGDIEGGVRAVAAAGDRLLAVGSAGGVAALWSSDDGGATWARTEGDALPPLASLDGVEAQGDVVVLSGTAQGAGEEGGGQVLLRSTDGGDTWQEATDPPPPNRGEGFAHPLSSGGGRFFATGHSFVEAWSSPELCYADIDVCRQDTAITLYGSDDGDSWARVDTGGIGAGEAGEVDDTIATDDGRVVAVQVGLDGVETWARPAGSALPTGADPGDPAAADLVTVAEGEEPEVGVRYAAPLYIHCGMEWLYLGDQPWQRTDGGAETETGAGQAPPDDWPVAQQTIFGFATLTDEGTVEYSIGADDDAEVIATYARPTEEPPGCR